MDKEKIDKILNELESGYDRMAEKFSQTRKFFWRDLEFISQYISDGDNILDFGCGNGRLLEIIKNKKTNYTGADISQALLSQAKARYPQHEFIKLSGQDILPFSDNYFNEVVSIAVFHHFPPEYAQKMASELYRITKPGGKIIITVWNLWQRRFWPLIFNVKKILKGEKLKDIYIPFKNNQGGGFDRYHHCYTRGELGNIFGKAGFEVSKSFTLSGKNLVVFAEKKPIDSDL